MPNLVEQQEASAMYQELCRWIQRDQNPCVDKRKFTFNESDKIRARGLGVKL
jgi:hypothetical protein